jgi:tetratricopeptide (TPR) repeat protein
MNAYTRHKVKKLLENRAHEKVLGILRKNLDQDPNDFETLYLLGEECWNDDKFEESAKYHSRAIKLAKSLKIDKDKYGLAISLSHMLIALAEALYENEQYEDSIKICDEVLSDSPNEEWAMQFSLCSVAKIFGVKSAFDRYLQYREVLSKTDEAADLEKLFHLKNSLIKAFWDEAERIKSSSRDYPNASDFGVLLPICTMVCETIQEIPQEKRDLECGWFVDEIDYLCKRLYTGSGNYHTPAFLSARDGGEPYELASLTLTLMLLLASVVDYTYMIVFHRQFFNVYYALALAYWNGIGDKVNYDKSFYWINRAHQVQPESEGISTLMAQHYFFGLGTASDIDRVLAFLKKPLAHKNPVALSLLGRMYEDGFGVMPDFERAFGYYLMSYEIDRNQTALAGMMRTDELMKYENLVHSLRSHDGPDEKISLEDY